MTPDPRPPYPRTPAYGEGHPPGGSRARTDASAPRTATPPLPSAAPRGVGLVLALSVAVNALTLVGVLALGWPAGNVFLLFWCENVVLGLVTVVRVATAADPGSTRVTSTLFFCVHYGIFCVVHLVFTWLLANALGVDLSWPYLALPVALLLVRYGVELGTTWFGQRGLRRTTSTRVAMGQPYPRLAVLHVSVLLGFGLWVAGSFTPVLQYGVLPLLVLVVLKSVVDVWTTRRALRPRPRS